MKTKHTQEYAEQMSKEHNSVVYDTNLAFTNGYMKAIEETAAPDLLEALNDMVQYFFHEKQLDDGEYIDMEQKAINAIKKATT